MDNSIDFDDLEQVELAAENASAPMLRYLIRQLERRLARPGSTHGEHGLILLLKLHHLLTQQQILAAHHRARETAYLAPDLVIRDGRVHPTEPVRTRGRH